MANKDISGRLKQARLSSGLTQKDVYEKLNIKQSRFSSWETGSAEPEIRIFLELCRIYGIADIYEYFCGTGTARSRALLSADLGLAVSKLKELHENDAAFRRVLNCLDFEYAEHLTQKARRYEFGTIPVPVYRQPAAAGLGNYITDDDAEIMSIAAPAITAL